VRATIPAVQEEEEEEEEEESLFRADAVRRRRSFKLIH